MATLATNLPTMLDMLGQEVNGKQQPIIEMLAQSNEVIPDVQWEEGNLPFGHKVTLRTSQPTITSRQLNAGVTPVTSSTEQVTDGIAILESYGICDKVLCDSAANPAQYRANEMAAVVEAFSQKFTSLLFSGNAVTTPSDFTGLAPRYSALGTTGISNQVIDAGGSGSDNSSIWFIGWGPRAIMGVYPRGGFAGMRHEDKGEQIWQTSVTLGASTSAMRAYVDWYEWRAGLSVRDYRYAVRIANVDVSEVQTLSGDQELTDHATNIINMCVRATYKVPNKNGAKFAFYGNRTMAYALHIMALNKASSQVTLETVFGKPVTMVAGYPFRTVDQLGIAEAAVT
jgi:hypothetical protein